MFNGRRKWLDLLTSNRVTQYMPIDDILYSFMIHINELAASLKKPEQSDITDKDE